MLVAVLVDVLEGVLAGAGAEADAGVEGAAVVAWSEVVDAVSFFSPAAGASLPTDGFILSE